MTSTSTNRQSIQRLFRIRNRFDGANSAEKLTLLRQLDRVEARTCGELLTLHATLCFIRAFPDTLAHHAAAASHLERFKDRVLKLPAARHTGLWDSGIDGTPIHYAFSFEVASWLARRSPDSVSIDWEELADTGPLDELLTRLLHPSEHDFFDSGLVTSKEWIEMAAAGYSGTNFDWLFGHLREKQLLPTWSQLYNAADLPLAWQLRDNSLSRSGNVFPVRKVRTRANGMRKRARNFRAEITRPLDSIEKMSRRSGSKLIDVAMASLAVRHRETVHFNHANPNEVYRAKISDGIDIAVFGLQAEYRYPLETTMGYLIMSNGVPVGYGGASALFRQVNTGINIFAEYRGSEAAFLWTQVMRVYRSLFGCTRFIVNAYQFGNDNAEALHSGAFWFYYRLGYRPVLAPVRSLAQRESKRMQNDTSYRSSRTTLRRLAECDMHLTLGDARATDLFEERWIETSSMLATRALAAAGGRTRAEAADRIAAQLARNLGIRSTSDWTGDERRGFRTLAPIIASTNAADWPDEDKRSMRILVRAKGASTELEYARLMNQHGCFLSALRKCCQRAERQGVSR